MAGTHEAVRAEALFASCLQCSDHPGPEQVRDAVVATLQRWGIQGCADHVAIEFGDHPETAVARMRWALTTVRSTYPSPPATEPVISPAPVAC